ncbi:MAG: hypothetical protein GY928_29755 [Colwellia sp.]|nr:hypothetical protein [Colwellia sp.]
MEKKSGVMGLCFILFFVVLGLSRLAIAAEVIVDNGGAGATPNGGWSPSGGTPYYGSKSVYSKDPAGTYTYTATVSDTGLQEVSMWWTEWRSRCTEVLVDISDGVYPLETVTINQQDDGGKWNILGSYEFTTGTANVIINAVGNACSTNADAVKFSGSDPVVGTSLDDIPSRIAGDPGVVSGSWTMPYTDAANATDGDHSTYAYGSVPGNDSGPDYYDSRGHGFITWDLGKILDACMVTLIADFIEGTHPHEHFINVQGSQDNVNWGHQILRNYRGDGQRDLMIYPLLWDEKEQTFVMPYRVRYIRVNFETGSNAPGEECRIYEIKVR